MVVTDVPAAYATTAPFGGTATRLGAPVVDTRVGAIPPDAGIFAIPTDVVAVRNAAVLPSLLMVSELYDVLSNVPVRTCAPFASRIPGVSCVVVAAVLKT